MTQKQPKNMGEKIAKPLRDGQKDILSDVLGSYTGLGKNGEVPEQDADDL